MSSSPDGGWRARSSAAKDERRLFYVGMTRARDWLAGLRTGDGLQMHAAGGRLLLCDRDGLAVVQLTEGATAEWSGMLARIEAIKVVAMLRRRSDDGGPAWRGTYRSEVWELPLVEVRLSGIGNVGGSGGDNGAQVRT